MDRQRLNFFLTCPSCKRKFGVRPEVVFKYLDRLLEETKKQLNEEKEKVRKRESQGALSFFAPPTPFWLGDPAEKDV